MNHCRLLQVCSALALYGLLSGCASPAQTADTHTQILDLAITNVTTIDAANGARSGQWVWIDDGRIVAVHNQPSPTRRAQQSIDGTGQYLIPGLWDLHVHVTYEPALVEQMATLFLDYGITSVRDTGGLLPVLSPIVQRWRQPDAVAPRIYFSGPLLDGAKVVYDGNGRSEIGIANPTPERARQNIETLVAAGVDFLKLYELVSPAVFNALVALARTHELPVAAHVPLALTAAVAGPRVDSMEHLRNIELACSNLADTLYAERQATMADSELLTGYTLRSQLHSSQRPRALADIDLDSPRCQQVIAALKNTLQVPTLRLNTLFTYPLIARADWLTQLDTLPPALAENWRSAAQQVVARTSPPDTRAADWSLALVQALHNAGVPIGAGTDTPIGLAIPGYSLHTELERLVAAGLSPLQALVSATVRPAEFFGLEHQMGYISADMAADLVLLSADPLQNIRNTRAITRVISKGQIVREY